MGWYLLERYCHPFGKEDLHSLSDYIDEPLARFVSWVIYRLKRGLAVGEYYYLPWLKARLLCSCGLLCQLQGHV
jgi:hypothetical protein